VQDFLVVGVLQRETNLRDPGKDLIFAKVHRPALSILDLRLVPDFGLEVAVVAVVHHDAQLALFGFVHLAEPRYVRVVQHFQYFGFPESFFPLFLCHFANVDLLYYRVGLVRLALNQEGGTE
jgi:hypothetical protein